MKKLLSLFLALAVCFGTLVLPACADTVENTDNWILVKTDYVGTISPIVPLANLCTNCGGQIGVKRYYYLSPSSLGVCANYGYPYVHRTMTVKGQKTCGSCGSVFGSMYNIESYEYCCYDNCRANHRHL